jgi:AraC-like DNA-binding protein
MEGISVTLRAGAASALLGVPASEIQSSAVHLDELWRGEASRVLERLQEAPDDTARFAFLEATLLQRLREPDDGSRTRAQRAAGLIADSGGRLALRAVAAAVGVGERRLQQLFHAHVGLSPRAWGRLARLHACLRALRQPTPSRWASLALDAGYFDQAHLVNEFRALSGLTPGAFLKQAVSGSSKTPG